MEKLSDGRFAGSVPVIISKERRPPETESNDPTKLRNATDLDDISYTRHDNNKSRKELG
jgi:hypothetical protein